jgi:site-specific DNA recombinase
MGYSRLRRHPLRFASPSQKMWRSAISKKCELRVLPESFEDRGRGVKQDAISVPAIDLLIETLVCEGIRTHLAAMGDGEPTPATADRDLIERHVARVIVKRQALEVCLIPTSDAPAQTEDPGLLDSDPHLPPIPTITLPWTAPSFAAVKGIVHAPHTEPAMKPESRDALLAAIAKTRGWIDDIRVGAIGSFAEIAKREAQGERHIRLLAPLAFLSPRIIAAIVDGTAPADLTVTCLAKALPYSWAEQEERVGLSL